MGGGRGPPFSAFFPAPPPPPPPTIPSHSRAFLLWGVFFFLFLVFPPPPPPPPHTTIRHTMCHLLCGGFFLSLFPRLPFNYAIIKSGQRDKNKTLRVLFLRKNKGPLCEARRGRTKVKIKRTAA